MTLQAINSMIAEMVTDASLNGYTYYQFPEGSAPELPYLIFYYPRTNNESADGVVWANINRLNIELYTENKEFLKESKIEAVLTKYGFFYNKIETYIDDEKMYEVLYEVEVVIS